MEQWGVEAAWRSIPPLDKSFFPMEQFRRALLAGADRPVTVAVEGGGQTSVVHACIHGAPSQVDRYYVNRLVKSLLWLRGGCRLLTDDETVYGWLREDFRTGGVQAFDADFMAQTYDRPFRTELAKRIDPVPRVPRPAAARLDGCRIGFDAGGSDRKAAAVRDGKVVYAEEVVWSPAEQADLTYHYREVRAALESAAKHLPRVDAVGISSAGIQIDDRTGNASLFRGIPRKVFQAEGRELYLRVVRDLFGPIPCRVINDGDAAALAGAMALGRGSLLGIAMGTSQAGGYVDGNTDVTGWLNELAFVPVDASAEAPREEWSGDVGCGADYFSQRGVIRLARRAGLDPAGDTPAEQLRSVQEALGRGDRRAAAVYETLGVWLGHSLAWYAPFYDGCRRVLLLGRAVSGPGGETAAEACRRTLAEDYPELPLELYLPEEDQRRIGQAAAAAAVPVIK